MSSETKFVDVILPLALPKLYTYRIQRELAEEIQVGQRVIVQFGKNKLYSALVKKVHITPPEKYEAKYIDSILDNEPLVTEQQFLFWDWLSSYYMCMQGEVMNAAIPSGLKLSSETYFVLNASFDGDLSALNEAESSVVEAFQATDTLSVKDIEVIVDRKTVYPITKKLIENNIIVLQEDLKDAYRPKLVSHIVLNESYRQEEKLKELFDTLNRAPAQLRALMAYIHWSQQKKNDTIKKSFLIEDSKVSPNVITELVKKEIFEEVQIETSRLASYSGEIQQIKNLSEAQQIAYQQIQDQFLEKEVVLLHGVTSSGKTEIYIKLIEEQLEKGNQVLYLLPEIALTTQIIFRLQKHFGNDILVYHSRYSNNERVEVWKKMADFHYTKSRKRGFVILGARSAIFLPYTNLGLIVIDEEHETSYKQIEPSPKYSGRDAGIYLAGLFKANVLLGSATPSIETYWNAQQKKYGYVSLETRFGNVKMPEILVADIKEDTRKKKMKSHFSPLLVKEMTEALERKEQIILFQNRRGFSPFLQCEKCLHIPKCIRCDVSLTYHKYVNHLKCHYCGFIERSTGKCGACGSVEVKLKGFGTEKIEEEISLFFPAASVKRMDLETTRSKYSYQHIINDFEDHKIDILVGTQMVTKGLDFGNVSLVGVLDADSLLYFPDFRAYERSFQLMAQVSGRAGRKEKRGKVIIQTMNPYHSVIRNVIDNDYTTLYNTEILNRVNFKYPPFYRLIQIRLKHRDKHLIDEGASRFADQLKKTFSDRILGPEMPFVSRVRNLYQKDILIKIERGVSLNKTKLLVQQHVDIFLSETSFKSIRILIDVDPL